MSKELPSYFHLHLISDATGETLATIAKAAIVQYPAIRAIEHVHSSIRTPNRLNRVIQEIESAPGIILYTIVNKQLSMTLEESCARLKAPCIPVLDPITSVLDSYLGAPKSPTVGRQHQLDATYFRRIDALNFTMTHDDGQLTEDLGKAEIIIIGVSRTSKTPTSIYLANRGFKTANIPLVPALPLPKRLEENHGRFVVGLIASPERIADVRRKRVQVFADRDLDAYVDEHVITEELAFTKRLCARHSWPIIDVTRRSIEETAASILNLYHKRVDQPAGV